MVQTSGEVPAPSYLEAALRDFKEEAVVKGASRRCKAVRRAPVSVSSCVHRNRSKAKAAFAKSLLFSLVVHCQVPWGSGRALQWEEGRGGQVTTSATRLYYLGALKVMIGMPTVGDTSDFTVLLREVIRRYKEEAGLDLDHDIEHGMSPLYLAMRKHKEYPTTKSHIAINLLKEAGVSTSEAEKRMAQDVNDRRAKTPNSVTSALSSSRRRCSAPPHAGDAAASGQV